ncbi:MAG TPA: glycosyltransferase family 1 protein [Terracidiphilus sp.]|jgi:glycosyltransferase involved in cell wall biosynthesis|nr:glycosyltransferase family 1 protein [Terracidiphilus sp.]
MNVVIAALSAPEHLNGVSRHCANVARGLLTRTEIAEVHLLAGDWQHNTYVDAIARQDPRLHIHPVAMRRGTLSRNLWYYSELANVAAQLNADVVHLGYPMPVPARGFRCPTVVSLHDLYPFDIPQNFGLAKSALNRQAVRQCLRSVDAIACVSESTRERLAHWLGDRFADKAVTVLNSVEPAVGYCSRAPQPLHRGQPFLLCIAQHRRNKNIPLAIKVFEQALHAGIVAPETMLVIIGVAGPETQRIREQVAVARLDRRIVLLSGIKDTELQWCYRNCELLLAPSSIEGFGLPVVEALLAGCRVVCSDIPAFREVGMEACHYVLLGPGEIKAFVEAIEKARNAPRVLPLSMPWLSPAAIAEKYLALYRHLKIRPADRSCRALSVSRFGSGNGL